MFGSASFVFLNLPTVLKKSTENRYKCEPLLGLGNDVCKSYKNRVAKNKNNYLQKLYTNRYSFYKGDKIIFF